MSSSVLSESCIMPEALYSKKNIKDDLETIDILSDCFPPPSDYIPEDSEEKKKYSFKEFCSTFLPHYFYQDSCEFHDEIMKLAEDETEEAIIIIAPRGFAKSTYCSVALPLWRICEGLSRFVLLVSDSSTQAQDYLRDITTELEENDELKKYYGEAILPKKDSKKAAVKWCDSDIITQGNRRIAARGTGQKLRGIRTRQFRPDFLIVDDMENDEHVQTPEQRKKTEKWFTSALLNCIDPDHGREFIVGTIIHFDSLLKKLMKNETYTVRFYKAIKDDGAALWPARWSLEKLEEKRKKIGLHAFNKEFLNNPLDPEAKPFKSEWLRYYTHASLPPNLKIYQAVDPAISQKSKADYFVIVTIGVDDIKNIYILAVFRKKLDFPSQVKAIIEQNKTWKPIRIAVEENGYQAALKEQTLTQERIPFKPIKNSTDKYTRILTLTPDFENGKVFISENFKDYIEEYEFYPESAHDDQLDCTEMAFRLISKAPSTERPAGKMIGMPGLKINF